MTLMSFLISFAAVSTTLIFSTSASDSLADRSPEGQL